MDEYIVGALSGMAGLVVGHPLDTTKVQMQTKVAVPYKNTFEAMKIIHINGWNKGFLRGLSFPLFSYGIVNSILFGTYGLVLNTMQADSDEERGRPSTGQTLVAGSVAGLMQLSVACPVDVIKVTMQSQINRGTLIAGQPPMVIPKAPYFGGPMECLRHLYAKGGLHSCYRGLSIMAFRDLPASSVYFISYEMLDLKLSMFFRNSIMCHFLSGGMAGVISWLLIFPIDVVKSVVQGNVAGLGQQLPFSAVVRQLYASKGISAFTAGLMPCLIRAFIVNAVVFSVHHRLLDLVQKPMIKNNY